MIKKFLSLGLAAMLMGCGGVAESISANFQYSNAGNLGTQNAGLYEPGSLFLWDTKSNNLNFVDVLPLSPIGGSPAPADVASSNVSAIELNGIPVGGNEDLLKSRIGAQASFVAKSAVREDYRNLVTALARYVTETKESGANPDLIFRPRDEGFRLVIIRSVIRAETSELRLGGTDATDPNSIVALQLGEGITFNVRAGSSTSCSRPQGSSGALPACFFNVAVYDPRYVPGNPRMQFALVSGSMDSLAQAFRGLR